MIPALYYTLLVGLIKEVLLKFHLLPKSYHFVDNFAFYRYIVFSTHLRIVVWFICTTVNICMQWLWWNSNFSNTCTNLFCPSVTSLHSSVYLYRVILVKFLLHVYMLHASNILNKSYTFLIMTTYISTKTGVLLKSYMHSKLFDMFTLLLVSLQ